MRESAAVRWIGRNAVSLSLFAGAFVLLGAAIFLLIDQRDAGITLEWQTENELELLGFNVYRADTPDGAYRRLNQRLIQATQDDVVGGDYLFHDRDVAPGVTYYYRLETVFLDGRTAYEGPIMLRAGVARFPQR